MSHFNLSDVAKATAVKCNNYTTWRVLKGGRFFASENDQRENAVIF